MAPGFEYRPAGRVFSGLRVLLVEDESAIAILIEDMLAQLGCELVASVARVPQARRLAENAEFDLAVLDINVAGEHSFELCDVLKSRDIPFMFSTGYGIATLPEQCRHVPVLSKPFSITDLEQAIAAALHRDL